MTAALEAWKEWKRRCAANLCAPASASALHAFALSRFRTCFRRYAGRAPGTEVHALDGTEAWHLFETHLVTGRTREGKRYKDWLFARVPAGADDAAALDTVQGGATLIMRDVVREHIRGEYMPAATMSIQQPLGGRGADLTLEDFLPAALDTAADVVCREYARLADRHADEFVEETSHCERIALLARQVGLPLSHPVVVRAAGQGKTAVSAAPLTFAQRITTSLRDAYNDENEEDLRTLCLMTLESVTEKILSWGLAENGPGRAFLLVKGTGGSETGALAEEGRIRG